MLTFTDRLQAVRTAAMDQIGLFLDECDDCEWKLGAGIYQDWLQANEDGNIPIKEGITYELRHIRKDGDKTYCLGEDTFGEEYDFEIDEITIENICYIVDQMVNNI